MLVRVKDNYELLGTGIRLSTRKAYKATTADNQPEYTKYLYIFVRGILLDKDEYIIIKDKSIHEGDFLTDEYFTKEASKGKKK